MNKKIFGSVIGILFMVFISYISYSVTEIQGEYILLEFYYDNGNLTLLNKSLEKGYYPTINHTIEWKYKINLVSDEDKLLYSGLFDPTILYSDSFYNNATEGETAELNETRFFVIAPNFKELEKIEILENNTKIFVAEVYDVGAESCRIK